MASKVVFLILVFLLFYAYAGFSIVLKAISFFAPKQKLDARYRPVVTIFVPAYNEEIVIANKIKNCLSLEYPPELLEIMVCSDASTDRTGEIVRQFSDPRITFFDYRKRSGKTGLINQSLPKARGEIVVLTDANTMLRKDAVVNLVRRFGSQEIGAVLGSIEVQLPECGRHLEKEVTYRKFETELKYREGLFGYAMGAFGGLYAVRKAFFEPLPFNAYSNDDFLLPISLLRKGKKVAFADDAVAFEETGADLDEEFSRRIRIGAGNFQSFSFSLFLLDPRRPLRAFLFTSHKVLRWFSPFLLIGILFSNALLFMSPVYSFLLVSQLGVYGLATAGFMFTKKRINMPLLGSVLHFLSMNLALLLGFLRFLKGIKSAAWESTPRTLPQADTSPE